MEHSQHVTFRVGAWTVNPAAGQMSQGKETVRVEARTMRLLVCLAEHGGQVVSIDDLLTQVWSGVIVSPDSVYQAVTSLRRLLGDDPKEPKYVATVPRLGYRMVADVTWGNADVVRGPPQGLDVPMEMKVRGRRGTLVALVGGIGLFAVCLMVIVHMTRGEPAAAALAKSVAVLPFLDLTEGMSEEVFADGMTEELIDKLSKVQGLMVPPPTSSFFFKGQKKPIAEIARSLGVIYLLDGSVRKSDATLRVAARLIRANDGFVIWSETYDRPLDDKLMVQDDIAGEVSKALQSSIN
jgi:transcriptional activator of cad operon